MAAFIEKLFLAYIKFYAATSNMVLVNQKQEILKTLLSRTFIVSRFKDGQQNFAT